MKIYTLYTQWCAEHIHDSLLSRLRLVPLPRIKRDNPASRHKVLQLMQHARKTVRFFPGPLWIVTFQAQIQILACFGARVSGQHHLGRNRPVRKWPQTFHRLRFHRDDVPVHCNRNHPALRRCLENPTPSVVLLFWPAHIVNQNIHSALFLLHQNIALVEIKHIPRRRPSLQHIKGCLSFCRHRAYKHTSTTWKMAAMLRGVEYKPVYIYIYIYIYIYNTCVRGCPIIRCRDYIQTIHV